MASWKNVVLTREEWDKFRPYVKANGYRYEPSGYYDKVYVSMWLTEQETATINAWLVVNLI